jgi:hypothetical protein
MGDIVSQYIFLLGGDSMKRFFIAVVVTSAMFVLGNAPVSGAAEVVYWKDWTVATKGVIPECGTDVVALGADDIFKALTDTYCKLKLGNYVTYINPTANAAYKARSAKYPDDRTAVMVFEKAGIGLTVDHKMGRIDFGVIDLKDGKSKASKDQGHPLNLTTCAMCHVSFNDACVSGMCGNRLKSAAK